MFKGCNFPSEIILETVRYFLAYKISYRDIEEIQLEHGVAVVHSTISRLGHQIYTHPRATLRRKKKALSDSWRMDETYIKIKDEWWYNYRAVDKFGDVIDYYFILNRDESAAKALQNKAIAQNSLPEKVVVDGSKGKE